MATAKLTTKYTAALVAANTRFATPEYDLRISEYAHIMMVCTHTSATGGFTMVPVGKIGADWLPVPAPTFVGGQSGGVTMPTSALPPYSNNLAPTMAFGTGKGFAYFSGNPTLAAQQMVVATWIPVHGFSKLCILVENYGSTLTSVAIYVGAGTV